MSPQAAFQKASSRLRDHLKNQRLRLTPERLLLLRAIVSQAGHFDAEQMSSRLSRGRHPISRATVYRNLGLFEECGIVRKSIVGQGRGLYESVVGREPHDHIVCTSCGRIDEFEDPKVEEAQSGLARSTGYRLQGRVFEVIGICPACQKRAGAPPKSE